MTTSILDRHDPATLKAIIQDPETPEHVVAGLADLIDEELHDWSQWARPNQLPPDGDWLIWLLVTGRRWGKTRTAAEWLREQSLETPGAYAVCAPTYGDVRDVCIEGGDRYHPSGFLSVCRAGEIENYNRSIGELRMVNGSRIKMLSADEPERARGWGFNAAWCDEFSSWRRPKTWTETLLPAVTMSDHHRFVITTTPKPNDLTKRIMARAEHDPRVVLVRGHTLENAENLGAGAVDDLRAQMTERTARQELEGELLLDNPDALWRHEWISHVGESAELSKVVVAIDPAVTSGEDADMTGIVVAGRSGSRDDPEFWVLADRSCRATPDAWARVAVDAFDEYQADLIVAETNNGGDLVERVMRQVWSAMPYKPVNASRGKVIRAEPVAALYEQGRVHHVGQFPALEEQLTSWSIDMGSSPDRLDALVWAISELTREGPRLSYGGAA